MSSSITTRPWGSFATLYRDGDCHVKRLVVEPGQRTSLQSHGLRDEVWVLVSGAAWVDAGMTTMMLYPGDSMHVRRRMRHRIAARSEVAAVLVEVQTGESFDEDDIVRYADDYGRAG